MMFNFFKKKNAPKQAQKINAVPVITVFATTQNGEIKELHEDALLQDGTCLVAHGSKYFHIHAGCCHKWSSEAFEYFNAHGGWKLIPIEEAKKQGLMPCLICEEEKRKREDFEEF